MTTIEFTKELKKVSGSVAITLNKGTNTNGEGRYIVEILELDYSNNTFKSYIVKDEADSEGEFFEKVLKYVANKD